MWQEQNNSLYKRYEIANYSEAGAFIQKITAIADSVDHHPHKVVLGYGYVDVWLTTHDQEDSVTDKDHTLAKEIDDLISEEVEEAGQNSEHVSTAKLYTDGGSRGNPGPSALGYVLLDMDDNVVKKEGIYLGLTTNNQAEYQGLKYGLEQAKKSGVRELTVYMDSLLVVNQMKGIYKVKNRDLWPIHQAAKDLVESFGKVSFVHVPRELNSIADGLVNDCLDANQ